MLPDAAIAVNNATHVAEARRVALDLAYDLDLKDEVCGNCALVVTELATNLMQHAKDGTIVVRQLPGAALEILSLDNGPGIRDTEACFRDGYSTGTTSGTGLGAVRRLSSFQEMYSVPGQGTAVMARVGCASQAVANLGAISIPYPGETECGDSWGVESNSEYIQITVADGLGHGPLAARASRMALDVARENVFLQPDQIILFMHAALRPTRGAAVASALCNRATQTLEYSGAGNIAGSLTNAWEPPQRLVSMNGTAGADIARTQTFRYPYVEGSLLVMHSDGLSARWSMDSYPGLHAAHPSLIAGVLFRDHRRIHDDATVVALRI